MDGACIVDQATLRSECEDGAKNFFEVVPNRFLGLAVAAAEFVTETRYRLCIPDGTQETWCPLCDQVLDTRGHHARICCAGGDRVLRHNRVRNENFRFCCTAGAHPELEKYGLLLPSRPSDGARSLRRPADVYLPCWTGGFPAALDFAVTAPQRQGIVSIAAVESIAAATAYSQTKRDYQETEKACAFQGVKFIPMVLRN